MTNTKSFFASMIMGILVAVAVVLPIKGLVRGEEAFAAAPEATVVAYLGETVEGDTIEIASNDVPLAAFPEEYVEKTPEANSGSIHLPSGKTYEGTVTEDAGSIVLAAAEATVILDGESVAVYADDMVWVYPQGDCRLALN